MNYFNHGLLLGGTASGLLLLLPAAAVQLLPLVVREVSLVIVVVLAVLCEVRIVPFRLPQNARQVPSSIMVRADGSGALQFGFEMGTGLRTFVPTQLPYLLVALSLLIAPWWAAPMMGTCFGFGRTLMVRSAVSSGDASQWDARFASHRRTIVALCWIAALGALTVIVAVLPDSTLVASLPFR
ncbi:hypothetical protein O7631_13515 [Micromonospora sp. WMMD967]|uniref:hypothetical protein n=1 Tax=Micromonospora sp. WMMD967 TaxID=3016101 RepID=UPI002416F3D6|nr:hypothetical protein [Micromonospora sp. WMMD967]MDG4837539.1 hypothetical protein [Micromonospora sp. WMMD967]